jgi:hypothetical protein
LLLAMGVYILYIRRLNVLCELKGCMDRPGAEGMGNGGKKNGEVYIGRCFYIVVDDLEKVILHIVAANKFKH